MIAFVWSFLPSNEDGSHPYIDMARQGNWVRAIDYFLSSSLMLVVTSILFRSPPDVTTLMTVAAAQGAIILVGYLMERIQSLVRGDYNPLGQKGSNSGNQTQERGWIADRVLTFGLWGPFTASILVYALTWSSLLIPFGYAVDNAPTAVTIFIVRVPCARRCVQCSRDVGVSGGNVYAVSICIRV